MAYTEKEFNYYVKNPKQINSGLDEDLLLALVDVNSSWLTYMKPHTLDFVKKVIAVDPTTFPYADRTVFTIQYLEEVIALNPSLIQYVYEPNDSLIKVALNADLNIINYFGNLNQTIYNWVLSKNGLMLSKIHPTLQNQEMVEIAIRQNIKAYEYAGFKNLYLDRIAVEIDPSMVAFISDYHEELIEYILDYNPMFLIKFIGSTFLTESIIKSTILKNPEVYKFVPNPNMNLMKYSALLDLSLMDIMPYNDELITYVLEQNGLALKYVRKKDLYTIKEAIKNNVLALQYVTNPRQHLIDYAFSLDGIAIQFVSNPTPLQYAWAINNNGYAIEFVPHEYQTADLQLRALSKCGTKVLPFITPLSDVVALEILSIEPAYIFSISEPTEEMYVTAFETNGQLILFYEDWSTIFNNTILTATLSKDGTLLEHIENKTSSMITAAINNYPVSIQWVTHQTTEMAILAVEIDPRVLFYVQPEVMDEYLLSLAIEIDPDYFTKIAGELTWEQWLEILAQNEGE